MIRYRYNSQLSPPAPFVHVTLRHPVLGAELVNVPAQVDSAADRSVIPQSLANQLGLAQMGNLAIGGLGGAVFLLPTYVVVVAVHDLAPQTIKVVAAADEPWMLLGAMRSMLTVSVLMAPARPWKSSEPLLLGPARERNVKCSKLLGVAADSPALPTKGR